ncbi:protein kinase domain-containing protein [Novipirellula sp. SH528]|uniref:protein kinase domain-containing protein n=1 Tax=Novipirellula sp. SH528 TaxID=3454466 RepID=UPI003FA18400
MRKHHDVPFKAPLQLPICSLPDSSVSEQVEAHGGDVVEVESFATAVFHPKEGIRIDHFRLLRELGEGTFGRVWLARDTSLNRVVAIKFPKFNLAANQVSSRRFKREAEIAAGLSHPNLIPILDAVLTPEKAYIVSEYCPGPTLDQWMHQQNKLVSISTAVSIVSQLASALRVAHHRDLMHRDIKPSNVIISKDDRGRPFANLTDFGMARSMTDVNETMAGTLIGSAPYMSPEQACGNIDTHGAHSDVYSLGVLLYELLTGVSPFAASTQMQTIQRVKEYDPPAPRVMRPSISRDLSAVVQRCLEKTPHRRYHDAGDLYDDLVRVAERRPTSARPIGRAGRTIRWAQRNPLVASLSTAAILGVLFGVASLSMFALNQRSNAIDSRGQTIKLQAALHYVDQSKQRLRAMHYDSDVSLAYLMFNRAQYGEARRLLDLHVPSLGEVDLRNTEWAILDAEVKAKYALWGRHSKSARELVVLPDKQTVATIGDDGNLICWDINTETMRYRLSGLEGQGTAIAALPDGKLAIPGQTWPFGFRGVITIDPATGKTAQALHLHPTTIESIRVAGDTLVSGCRYNDIKAWSFSSGRSIDIPSGIRNESVGLTPDGKIVVTGEHHVKKLKFFDTETGRLIRELDTPGLVLLLECSRTQDTVAYTLRDANGFGIVPIHPESDSTVDYAWIPTQSEPKALTFSDDDTSIAVADYRAGVEWFKLAAGDGEGSPPKYESTAFVSGSGGRMTDLAFLSSDMLITTGLDGAVERFSPDRMGHEVYSRPSSLLDDAGAAFTSDFRHALFLTQAESDACNALQYAELPEPNEAHRRVDGYTPVACREIWQGDQTIEAIAISPDDKTIAMTTAGGELILLRDWVGGTPTVQSAQLPMYESGDVYGKLKFSPTGRYLSAGGRVDNLQVLDLSGDKPKTVTSLYKDAGTHCVAFSSDDKQLVVAGGNEIEVIQLATGESRQWQTSFEKARCIEFTPNAKQIVVGWDDGSLATFDAKSMEPQTMLHGVTFSGEYVMQPSAIHFLSNHRLILVTHSGTLQFWDMDKRLQVGTMTVWENGQSGTRCDAVRMSDDASQLIIGCNNGDASRIYRWQIPTSDQMEQGSKYATR